MQHLQECYFDRDENVYDFLNMDVNAINSYMGEYMINYSWSEFTTGMLEEKNIRYNLLDKIKNKM